LFFASPTRLHRPYAILLVGMVFILIFGCGWWDMVAQEKYCVLFRDFTTDAKAMQ
jgi:hypothetical protein